MAVVDAEKRGAWIIGQCEYMSMGILHVDSPSLHGAGTDFQILILTALGVFSGHWFRQRLPHGTVRTNCKQNYTVHKNASFNSKNADSGYTADRAKQSLRSAYAIGADPTLSGETTDVFHSRGFFFFFHSLVPLFYETKRLVLS